MTTQDSGPVRRTTLAIGVALVCSAFISQPASAATLQPLVVQASDIRSAYGSGFKTLSSRVMRASDLGGVPTSRASAAALKKGFVAGYLTSFYRSPLLRSGKKTSVKSGVNIVSSGVSLYVNAAYPAGALELVMKSKPSILASLRKFHVTDTRIEWFNGVGEKAVMMDYSITVPALTRGGKATRTQAVTFIFSRGKFSATLNVAGYGTFSNDQTLALARHIDDRLQHAG